MLLHKIASRTPIDKGWSCDRKFCAVTADGTRYLLRITPPEKSGTRAALFALLNQVAKLGIPMCRLVEAGACPEGVYSLYTWIDGQDAEAVVPALPETSQYEMGLEAGRILKRIHTIPAPPDQEPWYRRFTRKADGKIAKYREAGIRFSGDGRIIEYLMTQRELLRDRPQCFQHGDYHIGNMMVDQDGLAIIDFDRYDFGDPWEEFNRIVWCAQMAPAFACGMVDGYFDGPPPAAFWQCLAFYIGSNTLSSIYWALDFGAGELAVMQNQARDVMEWYDGFTRTTPNWYQYPKG